MGRHEEIATAAQSADVHEFYEAPAIEERTPVRQPLIGVASAL